jgi:myo-inositol-1(or 4)-monophosphatase
MGTSAIMAVARDAALEGGRVLLEYLDSDMEVSAKGPRNLVTEADLAAERTIIDTIRRHFPHDSILAEESGVHGASERQWVIDPLDGTTNYSHRYPFFSVSLAYRVAGRIQLGIVYDPVAEELFSATSGGGAQLNGKSIRVSEATDLQHGFLATGFSYDYREMEMNLALFARVSRKVQAVRRDGSAALDLCYVACGRFDGYWELSLSPWDMAAGWLVVEEAGGRVSDLDGSPFQLEERTVLASNGRIHHDLVELLRAKTSKQRGGK